MLNVLIANDVRDDGVTYLSESVTANCTLTQLDLSSSRLLADAHQCIQVRLDRLHFCSS